MNKKNNKKNELLKNTILIFLGKVSTQFLSFFLLPLYTSYLTSGEYGYIDLIITYISLFVPLVTLQQEMAVFRFLIDNRNNEKMVKKIISNSLLIIFKIIMIFIPLFLLVILYFNVKYKYLIILNIIICIFCNFFLQVARGLGKNLTYSIASFIGGALTIVSNIILIIFCHCGSISLLISMAFSNSVLIIYLIVFLKIYNYISFSLKDKNLSKDLLKYSIPLIPNSISWWIINVSDRTIISLFLGVSSNGIYAVSCKFPSIVSSLFSIFNLSWSESASLHIKDDDSTEFFSSIFNSALKFFSCLSILIISFLPLIYSIIIGNNFSESYNYIPILIIGALFSCIVGIYSAIYIALKLTKKVAMTSIYSAIINIVINLALIKFIGLYAACISTLLSYLIMSIIRYIDIKKYIKIRINIKNIVFIVALFIISIFSYYSNNVIINILSLIFIIICCLILNYDFIKSIFLKLRNIAKIL